MNNYLKLSILPENLNRSTKLVRVFKPSLNGERLVNVKGKIFDRVVALAVFRNANDTVDGSDPGGFLRIAGNGHHGVFRPLITYDGGHDFR